MAQARPDWIKLYEQHHAQLGDNGIVTYLDAAAERFDLTATLADGGAIVFPHAAVEDCGLQIAAAVNAVLASGAGRVLVIGVLHGWTPAMQSARDDVARGADYSGNPMRGIHGPDLATDFDMWRRDHSLVSWRHFWRVATQSQPRPPQVREVYPFLAGADPTSLSNYEEVARWAEDAVVVATADMFHHGIGYGDPPDVAQAPHSGGLDSARASIEHGNTLLKDQAYPAYLRHCLAARSDARDNGPLLREIRSLSQATIVDLVASDMAAIYQAEAPTWVAAALVAWDTSDPS